MKSVFFALLQELNTGHDCELVTILSVIGTAPREPGCTMLVGARASQLAGTVGGGCIEWQALKQADRLLTVKKSGEATFEHGCRTEAEDASCGAVITLRFTYCAAGDTALIRALTDALNSDGGTLCLPEKGEAVFRQGAQQEAPFHEDTLSLYLPPPDRVLLFGAGHVAQALVPLLKPLGFTVFVYDNRKDIADEAHFPQADTVTAGPFSEDLALLTGAKATDYIVIMSAAHRSDELILSHFTDREYRYIGMLGSRKKAVSIKENLIKTGVPEARLHALHIPIGLSIGARTPEEVALSVAAELVSIRAQTRQLTD